MGVCLSKRSRRTARNVVPRLEIPRKSEDEPHEVPYKDTWLKGKVDSIEGDTLNMTLFFDGTAVKMKVRTSDGSIAGIGDGEVRVKPLSWGRKTSIVAEIFRTDKTDQDE